MQYRIPNGEEALPSVAVHVRFRGHVQGVSFRFYAKRFADANDVRGWVRNLEDGTVEALFEGERNSVRRVIEQCRKENPHAGVTEVEASEMEYTGRYQSFVIR